MPHDLLISYAHQGDDTSRKAVAALVAKLQAELEADFRRRFKRDLEIFFDKEDIKGFDHWLVRCDRALWFIYRIVFPLGVPRLRGSEPAEALPAGRQAALQTPATAAVDGRAG